MQRDIIQRGAEAVLYLDTFQEEQVLVKERIKKGYRHPELDEKIRSRRTRGEERLLSRARRAGVDTPGVRDVQGFKLVMDWIEGEKLKDTLNGMDKEKRMLVYGLMGNAIARLHSSGIVHGDLTTSNMLLKDGMLYLVDFGLGKVSGRVEDHAVDLFLLYEALKSTHFIHLEEAWKNVLNVYSQNYERAGEVLKRFGKISARRRYKGS